MCDVSQNENRVAVVTGGTRGIGAAIARELKAAGYKVAATYASDDEAAALFTQETGIMAYKFDVSDYAACQQNIARIEADHGPVDVLVNNAGITRDTVFHAMTPEQWSDVITTNLNSVFNMTRLVIGGMRDRKFGRVINISSINGLAGQVGQTNYAAAKAGMIGFTKSLALEVASKGVTVNAIAPGYIDTDMVRAVPEEILNKIIAKIPVKRLGQTDEIARLVVFIAAEGSGFITGATLNANGGQYLT